MSYVQADPQNYKLDFGKYKGWTLAQIASSPSGLSYLKYCERCSYGYALRCIRAFLKALKAEPRAFPPQSPPPADPAP